MLFANTHAIIEIIAAVHKEPSLDDVMGILGWGIAEYALMAVAGENAVAKVVPRKETRGRHGSPPQKSLEYRFTKK
jgi:hypothetical protein